MKTNSHIYLFPKQQWLVNNREKSLLYNLYFRQTAILLLSFFFLFPFTLFFFFPYLFVLILSNLSGTCLFFQFAGISGRNFLSSFGRFWAELFFQVGGARALNTPPPLRTRLSCRTGLMGHWKNWLGKATTGNNCGTRKLRSTAKHIWCWKKNKTETLSPISTFITQTNSCVYVFQTWISFFELYQNRESG